MKAIIRKSEEVINAVFVSFDAFNNDNIYCKEGDGETFYKEHELMFLPNTFSDKSMMVYELAKEILFWKLNNDNYGDVKEVTQRCVSLAKALVEECENQTDK